MQELNESLNESGEDNIEHDVSFSNLSFQNFIENNENTMNTFSCSAALNAFTLLKERYKEQISESNIQTLLSNFFKDVVELKLLEPHEHAETFCYKIISRLTRKIHEYHQDGLADNMPLEEVVIAVLLAISDTTIDWKDKSTYADRLLKLKKCFNFLIEEPRCDVGIRNDVLSILHNSFPGIYMLTKIKTNISELIVRYYEEKLHMQLEEQAETGYQLLQALVQHSLGETDLRVTSIVKNFYNPEVLPAYLNENFKIILGDKGLSLVEKELKREIQEVLLLLDTSILPMPASYLIAIKRLESFYQAQDLLPFTPKDYFENIKTLQEFAENHVIQAYLLAVSLKKVIQPYLDTNIPIFGEEGLTLYKVVEAINKILVEISHSKTDTTDQWLEHYSDLLQYEKNMNEVLMLIGKDKNNLMESSFCTFFALKKNESLDHIFYYEKILQHFIREKLEVSDELIEKWSKQVLIEDKEGRLEFVPTSQQVSARYLRFDQINCLIWTALTSVPLGWSDTFSNLLVEVVNLLDHRTATMKDVDTLEIMRQTALRKSSYPPALIDQLKWLLLVKKCGVEFTLPPLDIELPLPCNLGHIEFAHESERESFLENYPLYSAAVLMPQNWIPKKILNQFFNESQLTTLFQCMNIEQQLIFIERFKEVIDSYGMFCLILRLVYPRNQLKIIDIMGVGWVQNLLQKEPQYASVFGVIDSDNQLPLIEKLGSDFVKNKLNVIFLCSLSRNNQMDFMKKEIEFYKKCDVFKIHQLLSQMHQDNKFLLIELFGIDTIVDNLETSKDLRIIIQSFYREKQIKLIEMIGIKKVKSLLKNSKDLACLLPVISESNQMAFIQMLSIEFVKTLLKNSKDLACLLPVISKSNQMEFIQMLSIEFVKTFFKEQNDWAMIFPAMHKNNQIELIKLLEIEYVQKFLEQSSLNDFFDMFNKKNHLQCIEWMGFNVIESSLTNAVALKQFLACFKDSKRCIEFIEEMGSSKLQKLLRKKHDVLSILACLDEEDYPRFSGLLDIQRMIRNDESLVLLMLLLTGQEDEVQLKQLNMVGQALPLFFEDISHFLLILNSLNPKNRLIFLKMFQPDVFAYKIESYTALKEILGVIAAEDALSFLRHLGSKHITSLKGYVALKNLENKDHDFNDSCKYHEYDLSFNDSFERDNKKDRKHGDQWDRFIDNVLNDNPQKISESLHALSMFKVKKDMEKDSKLKNQSTPHREEPDDDFSDNDFFENF